MAGLPGIRRCGRGRQSVWLVEVDQYDLRDPTCGHVAWIHSWEEESALDHGDEAELR